MRERMKTIRFTWRFFRGLNRDAALDSLRNVLAVLGLATVIGDFDTMRTWFLIPAAALLFAVWFADYLRHDFSAVEQARAETCRKDLEAL
jgi:hypothetical protein